MLSVIRMTERIAIVAWGAMADILYATPIVRQIRRMSPGAYITWMVRDKFTQVIETNPYVDEVRQFSLPTGHESRQDAEYVMDQQILGVAMAEYDKVYDLQYWPRYSNFFENPTEDFISLRARNARMDPIPQNDRAIDLILTKEDYEQVEDFYIRHLDGSEGFITVNHISYAASPVWSFENYERLVQLLRAKHIDAVFTGAPNEPLPEGAVDARGMPYRQWAGLIQMSDLWLGLDSGAVALACATTTPIIKLHSPDFPLAKTGIKAMGLRHEDVRELCPAPNPETMASLIVEMMR